MAKKDTTPSKKKDKYRIRNWREYNQSLVNRGSITFWFSPKVLKKWYSTQKTGKPGRPEIYSDDAIRSVLMIKIVFHQALRQLKGLVTSLLQLLGFDLKCPHYSSLSRRAKELEIPLSRFLKPGERLNVIFDSTGIKVYGEGEWKVRKHGYSKRRTWRKVHVGMCADSGQVVITGLTTNNVTDDEAMVDMLCSLSDVPIGDVLGDGAYDTTDCRQVIHDLGGRQMIPPKKNARLQKKNPLACLEERDKAISRIKELGEEGRAQWKKEVGYHRRSRVETFMFRYKTIVGEKFSARKWCNQVTEARLKVAVLNQMIELGMPKSYKLSR